MDKFYNLKGKLFSLTFKDRKHKIMAGLLSLLIFSLFSLRAHAQNVVTGTVSDAKGNIPGATVKIKGTSNGAQTDENGKYTLKNVPANATIVFSSIGYITKELAAKSTLNVILVDDAQNLNEVLVVGYGTQKKATLTGSVAQIGAEEIMRSPTPNATNTLIGKLTGLLAVQTSGQPGADGSNIFIRGISTFTGAANASAIVVVDGIERPSFGDVDPNEIETITVLKDASATAIYGIKGANGVIVITTKVGKLGKANITYTGNYSIQTYTGLPFALGAYDNVRLLNQAYANDGKAAPFTDAEVQKFKDGSDPYGYPDVQWFKYLTKKFYGQTQHNFNVSGGSKVAKYFVSAGYAYQDGIFKHFDSPYGIETTPSYTRYNFRSNIDLTFNKDFTVGIKLGGRYSDRYQPAGLLSSSAFSYDTIEGMISRILQVPSFAYPVTLPDGRIAQNPGVGTNLWNPLAVLTRFGTRNDDQNTVESTFNLEYKLGWITKGLTFRTNFGYDSYYSNVQRRNANWAAYVYDRTTGAVSLSTDTRNRDVPLGGINAVITGSTTTTLQTGFYYNRSFGKHTVGALLLANRQLVQGASDGASIFTAPPSATQGLANRISYNYDERYLVELNAAYNGTDQFASSYYSADGGKQYGFFPAISAGWVLSNEKFFPKNSVLNYFKLKGSYGLVGNDKLGSRRFLFLTSYSSNTAVQFGAPNSPTNFPTIYIASDQLGNPGVTWETGKKRNIAVETRLFHDHVKLNVDVFDENRTDILANPKDRLVTFGHNYPPLNIGRVYNKGYEVEFDYQGQKGNLTWGLNAQLSYAKNIVKYAAEPSDTPDYLKLEGKSVGQFIGYVSDGFYQSAADIASSVKPATPVIPGDLKFKDLNGDGVIDQLDQTSIGYSNTPEYIYSFTPRVAYKGFTLSVMLQGVGHVSSNLILNDQNNGQQMYPFMLNAWTPENAATATWPALHSRGYTGLNNALSTFNIQNARYLKLRNVEIAYNLPKSLTDAVKLQSVRIYLNGQNLITWTPFKMYVDPENLNVVNQAFPLQSLYPSSRVFNIGMNVKF